MTTTTTASFDLARFTRATEERDASTQLSMYAPEATVNIADRINQPGSPRALRGSKEIKGWIEEVTSRDMTHAVQHAVSDDTGAAFTVTCRYPDGTSVLCATVLELEAGYIARQTVVQVWDETSGDIRQETEHKSFGEPDQTREFPNGRAEILSVGGADVGRMTFEPGWRWSNDVKPIAGTSSCEAPHFQYHVGGRLAIRMDDGTEMIAKPGDITSLPSGHDAWVVGDEPVVVIDWYGASSYARAS